MTDPVSPSLWRPKLPWSVHDFSDRTEIRDDERKTVAIFYVDHREKARFIVKAANGHYTPASLLRSMKGGDDVSAAF